MSNIETALEHAICLRKDDRKGFAIFIFIAKKNPTKTKQLTNVY